MNSFIVSACGLLIAFLVARRVTERMWSMVVLFAITPVTAFGQNLNVLINFNGSNGDGPAAALIKSTDGNFYGTTVGGPGSNCNNSGCGTVFKVTPAGDLTTLHVFCATTGADCTDGAGPVAALVQGADGNFYGTTRNGGGLSPCSKLGCGNVFKMTQDGTLTNLHRFSLTDGAYLLAPLVKASDGNLYSTTWYGGTLCDSNPSGGCGTVFTIAPDGAFTSLYKFCSETDCADGVFPSGLVQATDGNLYGLTTVGWTGIPGTFFKVTLSGDLTVISSFSSDAPYAPQLIQGTDGNFYGLMETKASAFAGTVFTITPSGTVTILYKFCAQSDCTDGETPMGALVQAADGDLYGTTFAGGSHGGGTVFKITSSGKLTTLYSFCSQPACADGKKPYAGLVQGTDGMFYGTTLEGGTSNKGTIFSFGPWPLVTLSGNELTFASQMVGTSSTSQAVSLRNNGSAPLKITSISTSGDFSETNTCGSSLAEGDSCEISIAFKPTITGNRDGNLTIQDNAPGTSQTIKLSGIGLMPQATLSPTVLTFGSQPVGTTSAAQIVTLKETGGVAFTITSVSVSGDFAEAGNDCGNGLSPGDSCSIPVTFTPTAAGTRSGSLTIIDSAPGSPHVISLSGTGVAPAMGVAVASGGSNSASVAAGQTASYKLSIGGMGMSGTASLSCSGAPAGASCSVPSSLPFSSTKPTPFTVTVKTTARTIGELRIPGFERSPWWWAVGLLGLLILPKSDFKSAAKRCSLILGTTILMMLSSCGGSSSPQPSTGGTPAGTYTLTVTATSGTTSQSLPLTLKVQ